MGLGFADIRGRMSNRAWYVGSHGQSDRICRFRAGLGVIRGKRSRCGWPDPAVLVGFTSAIVVCLTHGHWQVVRTTERCRQGGQFKSTRCDRRAAMAKRQGLDYPQAWQPMIVASIKNNLSVQS